MAPPKPIRAAFFGSPEFAVPCLDALHSIANIAAVFSQPDRPKGRGLKLTPPAVKKRALELELPVFQPKKVRDGTLAAQLRELRLDVALVVAYGRILPKDVLDAPRVGCVNVHASLLPRWRGAAPIQWSIASGDSHAGVSLMAMDEGMDTGAVYAMADRPIEARDTAGSLSAELSAMGAELLKSRLEDVVHHGLQATPQPEDGVTHARMLTKEDARIDWSRSASAIDAHRRGMTPWPGCFTTRDGERVKVHDAAPTRAPSRGQPGTVLELDERGLLVNCGEGVLALKTLQPAGRKRLDAASYVAGYGTPERFGAKP